MTAIRNLLAAGAVAALVCAGPALAEGDAERGSSEENPLAMAEEGARTLLRALDALMASIPHYELPQVLENGDIIIRRVPRNEADANGDGIEEVSI